MVKYKPISGSEASYPWSARLLAAATAPAGGSHLLFPRNLARALASAGPDKGPAVPNHHARWFFGSSAVIWIDPRKLALRLHDGVMDGRREIRLSRWFVDGGDWSDIVTPVAHLAEHRETLNLIRYGKRYPRMRAFQRMVERARANRPAKRYGARLDSEESIHAYFRYFLKLIDDIRANGFLESGDLSKRGLPEGLGVRGRYAFQQRNIGAAVAADGTVLRFLGGRHRTAIAQALAVPVVPVEIRFVHAGWLASEASRTGLAPARALQAWARRISAVPTHPGRVQPAAMRGSEPAEG